ncbi:hypothetical protein [Cetobacterium sp. ZOR0034]|uniref:hypothetical protein n=1 Tax=Cetobacterium sp. ZOR0034 TaxID=1339239 RepID=UPI00064602A2|nr:hypothetical protein [Cetobacterium sp. ZOR0034]
MRYQKHLEKTLFLFAIMTVIQNTYTQENKIENIIVLDQISTDESLNFDLESQYEEQELITPGRMVLKNNGGYIYSIIDPIPVDSKLSIKANHKQDIELGKIDFFIYTNYEEEIKRWEILIYEEDDLYRLDPIGKIEGTEIKLNEPILFSYKKETIKEGERYFYTLKVFDEGERFNQTEIQEIQFVKAIDSNKNIDVANSIYGKDNTAIKNIHLKGSKVRVYGKDIQGVKEISVNNQVVNLDSKGDFLFEYYTKNTGEATIPVLLSDNKENQYIYDMQIYLPNNYTFAVGMADLFVGQNYVSGSDTILQDSYKYDENIFSSGRLAFYYKKVWDDYRLTAQADTWEQETKYIFKDFSKRRPRDLFEKLERDDIEFNLGDESTYYSDTDSTGKFYIKLEKQQSSLLWGSYNTGFTGNYYTDYNRSLYGAQGIYNSLDSTKFGDSRTIGNIFVSEPETLYTRDEFRGTGGSVYYLSFQDIVTGSAKVKVQVTDGRTGRVLREIVLEEGRDYSMNDLQGRIILKNPLPTIASSTENGIIKDLPYSGDSINLVVEYEFYSSNTDFAKSTYGLRGKTWITDNLAIGGTLVSETRGDEIQDYELEGVDLTLRKTDNTFIRFEYAHSKGTQTLINNFSYNGGYDSFLDREKYEEIISNPTKYFNNISGDAYSISGEVALKDIDMRFDPRDGLTFWYHKKEAGFSSAGFSNSSNHDDYGFESSFQLTNKWVAGFGASKFKEKDTSYLTRSFIETEEDRASMITSYQYNEKLKLSTELEYIKNQEKDRTISGNDLIEKALLIGVRADYEFEPNKSVYGIAQTDIWSEGYGVNNLYTLGTKLRLTDKFRLNTEASTGNKGNGVEILGTYDFTENYSLYTGYALDNNNEFGSSSGKEHTLTLGQKYLYDSKTSMYHENQFLKDSIGTGFLQSYGIDYTYSQDITVGTLIQHGDIDTYSGNLSRTSLSIYSRYYVRDMMLRNKLEFGKDRGAGISADRWATINRGKWILNDEYTLFGEFNYLYRDAKENKDDRSIETGLGLGYRPVWNDKLNLIGKYEYVENIGINNQFNSTNDTKAHILSLEGIYELTQKLDIGGKYAFRTEEFRAGRGEGDWYNSKLDLYAVRLNYEVIKSWYAFAEYHLLRDIEEEAYEHGAILGVYKEVQQNLKVGAGYNFTKFDDDLSDLDYNAKGWFINIIGKF